MKKGELQPNVSSFDALTSFPARFWFFIIVTGLGAGIGGGLLMQLLYAVQKTAWSYQGGSFLDGVEKSSYGWRVLVLFLTGVFVGVGRWGLQYNTGGHAGEIASAIWFNSGKLPVFWTYVRATLSIAVVGLGASIGREGALKQAGAAVASWISGGGRLSPSQRRLLVACGAGAGAAVAYNVPFGGALFALEVLLGELSLPLVIPALATSFIATWVSWNFLYDRPTYLVPEYQVTVPLLVFAVLAGPIFGLASAAYIHIIGWADARKPKSRWVILTPILMLTALGLAAIPLPQLLGNGKDLAQLSFVGELSLFMLLVLPVLKVLATAGCLGSGTPGGLFTPTMTFGALLGGLMGAGWNALWPGTPVGSFALLGSGAILAAATQGPLSSIVMVIELTRRLDPLMVPMLMSVSIAVLVARAIDARSVYTARIHLARSATAFHLTPTTRTAFDDRISQEYEVVSTAEHYAEVILRLLARSAKNWPLYVVDEEGKLLGEVSLARAESIRSLSVPLEVATAGDLASPVPILSSKLSPDEMERAMVESKMQHLPVIDSSTGRLIGVVDSSSLYKN